MPGVSRDSVRKCPDTIRSTSPRERYARYAPTWAEKIVPAAPDGGKSETGKKVASVRTEAKSENPLVESVVRLAGFEPATFGSGDRRSSPAELQAHALKILDLARKSNP